MSYNTSYIHWTSNITTSTSTSTSYTLSLILHNDHLIVYHNETSTLYSYNSNNGTIEWMVQMTSNCSVPYPAAVGTLYFVCDGDVNSTDTMLLMLDPNTGQTLANSTIAIGLQSKVNTLSILSSGQSTLLIDLAAGANATAYKLNGTTPMSNFTLISPEFSADTQTIMTGERSIISRDDGFIVTLACNNDNALYLMSYNVSSQAYITNNLLASSINCSTITYGALMITPVAIIATFTTNNSKSYLAKSFQAKIHWTLRDQDVDILDTTMSGEGFYYLCTTDTLYQINSLTAEIKNLGYKTSGGKKAVSCRMSNGENTVMAFLRMDDGSSVVMRASDSLCPNLCQGNTTCTTNACQCAPGYYPADQCSVYCLASDTCRGHGDCQPDGSCLCDPTTGYYGDDCSNCRAGYFGPNCNAHLNWKTITIASVISVIVTSGICIFACLTSREAIKRRCGKWRRKCCGCIPSRRSSSSSSSSNNPTLEKQSLIHPVGSLEVESGSSSRD
ncbi:hypothetical protein SAMD00019534_091360, partial [Acytostelium subglobosum LB1]|uniref:hypothetical protein n=1 Tax=Acytostelium subglobosum LB1 TaxID=1410327 RepID=UPI0006448970